MGSPVTVTVTVSRLFASVTGMRNASIATPCMYVLSSGAVIVGGVCAATVIVNVAVTSSSFTPSFAVTVTV